jgi:hypothetical protein
MSEAVRVAPRPTGLLHVGDARPALTGRDRGPASETLLPMIDRDRVEAWLCGQTALM